MESCLRVVYISGITRRTHKPVYLRDHLDFTSSYSFRACDPLSADGGGDDGGSLTDYLSGNHYASISCCGYLLSEYRRLCRSPDDSWMLRPT